MQNPDWKEDSRVPHLRDGLIVAKVGSALPKAGVKPAGRND